MFAKNMRETDPVDQLSGGHAYTQVSFEERNLMIKKTS